MIKTIVKFKNKMLFAYTVFITVLFSCSNEDLSVPSIDVPVTNATHYIVPLPVKVKFSESTYTVSSNLDIRTEAKYLIAAKFMQNVLSESGISSSISVNEINPDIVFNYDANLEGDAYKIEINPLVGISILVNTAESAFYAVQTLRQYFWISDIDNNNNTIKLNSVIIEDQPENEYRGFHIDVSRHFFPKEFIFKIIDQMALYKLNKLQIHLTDDQGWRFISDTYPLLTKVGATRDFDENDEWCIDKAKYDSDYNFNSAFVDGNTYTGFYSKQDLKDIVSYAAENYIEVIPEIDMPGHMSAAIRAYSWISCNGQTDWGLEFSQPMCVSKEEVMLFAKNIWDEVIEIFPSRRVHIGADEVDKTFWEDDPVIKQFMQENDWPHVNYVQNYFVSEITSHLEEKGKKVTAWDDILVSNDDDIVNAVSPTIDIMYWRDYKQDGAIYAAQNGNKIILTPWSWFYLSSDNTDENFIEMYNFNEANELDSRVINNKIGYQACVWTERIPSEAVFEKFVFPRFQGYSEVAWSRGRDFNSFKKRLKRHLSKMNETGINYRKPGFMN